MGAEPRHSPTGLFARRGFMHAMSRTVEDTPAQFAEARILVRYKRGYVARHLTLPHRDLRTLDALLDTISKRRFCGSRTPSGVGTSRPFSPTATAEIAVADKGRNGRAMDEVVEHVGHVSTRPRRSLAR